MALCTDWFTGGCEITGLGGILNDKKLKRNSNRGAKRPSVINVTGVIFTTVSLILFMISLLLSAYYTNKDHNGPVQGYLLLLIGWIGIIGGHFSWLANPSLLMTWTLMCFKPTLKFAIYFGSLSMALSLSFLFHEKCLVNSHEFVAKITGYGPGYYFWVASMAVALLGALFEIVINMQTED